MVMKPTFPINLVHLSGVLPESAATLLAGAPPLDESESGPLTVVVSDQLSLVKDWITSNPTPSWVLLGGSEADWHCTQALELGASECWSSQENEDLLPFRIARAEQLAIRSIEMGQQTSDLAILMELTAALTSAQDIGDILRTVVTRVVELGSFGRASIILAPDESDPSVGFVVAASDDDELSNLRLDLQKYQRCNTYSKLVPPSLSMMFHS